MKAEKNLSTEETVDFDIPLAINLEEEYTRKCREGRKITDFSRYTQEKIAQLIKFIKSATPPAIFEYIRTMRINNFMRNSFSGIWAKFSKIKNETALVGDKTTTETSTQDCEYTDTSSILVTENEDNYASKIIRFALSSGILPADTTKTSVKIKIDSTEDTKPNSDRELKINELIIAMNQKISNIGKYTDIQKFDIFQQNIAEILGDGQKLTYEEYSHVVQVINLGPSDKFYFNRNYSKSNSILKMTSPK